MCVCMCMWSVGGSGSQEPTLHSGPATRPAVPALGLKGSIANKCSVCARDPGQALGTRPWQALGWSREGHRSRRDVGRLDNGDDTGGGHLGWCDGSTGHGAGKGLQGLIFGP